MEHSCVGPQDPNPNMMEESQLQPSDLTAWFEDPNAFEHILVQQLCEIRSILAHYGERFKAKGLPIPPEGEVLPTLLTQVDEFSRILVEETQTLYHPDLMNWFANQDWQTNRIIFAHAFTGARYMQLDITYIIEMINEKLIVLQEEKNYEEIEMAKQLRQGFEEAEKLVFNAYRMMKEHSEHLKQIFPEAFEIEEENDVFWGRRA